MSTTQPNVAETLVHDADDALLALSSEGTVLSWNRGAEVLFGYQADEAVGRLLDELIVPSERVEEARAARSRALLEGSVLYESVRRTRSGAVVPVQVSEKVVKDSDGRVDFIAVTQKDINHLKRLREVELAEAKFRGLLESAPDAIVIVNRSGRISIVNHRAETMFGYARDELLGKPVEMLMPHRFRAVHLVARDTYAAAPRARLIGTGPELIGQHKDGTEFPVEISLSPLAADEGMLITSVIRDISERRNAESAKAELEERLRQAQKMEAIGRLAGGVAHDFNNLLAVILSYADVLAEDCRDEAIRQDLEEIRRAALRASELTRKLLIISRKEVSLPVVLNLNEVVVDVTRLLRRTIGEDIEVVTELGPGALQVKAAAGQVEQVVMNVALNARDAMPGGGKLVVHTARIVLEEGAAPPDLRAGRYASLVLSDTGCGMTGEVAARIFEPFFTTKPEGKGTGLGLATVYGIVKQAGGHIEVETSPGQGATFRILWPLSEGAETTVPPPPHTLARAGSGETILVAEDEDALRELVRRVLTRNGYRVLGARGSGEALIESERHDGPIHLLLTDVIMPQMSGVELAGRLRSLRPGLRVLFMSGYAGDVGARREIEDSGMPCLQKPFSSDELLARVREALESSATS